jgi:hypothetical protein
MNTASAQAAVDAADVAAAAAVHAAALPVPAASPELTPYDVTPAGALAALAEHRGLLIVDLDETLYLGNSTEDYINCATPRLLALCLMRLLDLIKPWRWNGGEATRDLWRVRLLSACCPWLARRWLAQVDTLAARWANLPLLGVLQARRGDAGAPLVIATLGFGPVVRPLIAALGLAQASVIAARLDDGADRRLHKLGMCLGVLGPDRIGQALVLTDAAQDRPLLDACQRPLRVVWPQACFRPALRDVYLPGQYLSLVKRPGERYITRAILQEDFAFWLLSSIALAALPLAHAAGLLLLLISFWTVYERGYVDNDLIAARWEAEPKLAAGFKDSPVATPTRQPWIWALASGALGVWVLRWTAALPFIDLLVWAGVLLATYAWFTLYNRYDKGTRVWLFAGLQFARSAAFVALVPISPIGAAALGAHVLAKWVPYYVYRLVGQTWPEAPFHLSRLLFFVVLAALTGFAAGASSLLNGTALALLAWCLFRARRELASAYTAARRLDRHVTEPAP